MLVTQSTLITGEGTRPNRVVLWRREHDWHPFVVHYQLEEDRSRFQGSYCATLTQASKEFERRCKLWSVVNAYPEPTDEMPHCDLGCWECLAPDEDE
jgi:hypothetical protein